MKALHDYKAYLFDLDGTLIDSASDIATAVNLVREEEGLEPLSLAEVSAEIGHGAMALIKGCFPYEDLSSLRRIRERFVIAYQSGLCVNTRAMKGAEHCLERLALLERRLVLVTNKPRFLGEPLLNDLGWSDRFHLCYYGDTLPLKKPNPLPILEALKTLEVLASEALFIGDTEVDAEAAQGAGVDLGLVSFGRAAASVLGGEWGKSARVVDLEEFAVQLASLMNTVK